MSPYRTGRYLFLQNVEYAGKLIAVTKRSIENRRKDVAVLRLEFELYTRDETARRLTAIGAVASRDVVITPDAASDNGVRRYSDVLKVCDPTLPSRWYGLQRRNPAPWILVQFGKMDQRDFRQSFETVNGFDPEHGDTVYSIYNAKISAHRDADCVTSSVAAKFLSLDGDPNRHPSVKKVNQVVDQMEPIYGRDLMYRTPGGQRRINWKYLQQIWNMRPNC